MNNDMCRLCLTSRTTGSDVIFKNILFSVVRVNNCREIKLIDAIMDCTPIRIDETDELSKEVCDQCIEKVGISYTFRQLCLDTDYKLKLHQVLAATADGSNVEVLTDEDKTQWAFQVVDLQIEKTEPEDIDADDDIANVNDNYSDKSFDMNMFLKKSKGDDSQEDVKPIFSYECEFCSEKFETDRKRQNHMEVHLGERPYVCEFCNKGFKQSSHLGVHRKIHTGDTPHICGICNKKFITKGLLRQHNERKHANVRVKRNDSDTDYNPNETNESEMKVDAKPNIDHKKNNVCEFCAKRFNQRSHLLVHRKIHTGDTRHICQICVKKFTTKGNLRLHNRRHHPEIGTDGKPRPDVMNKIIVRSIKQELTCHECNKSFWSNSVYQNHLRVHTGLRPFTCEICGKGFKQTSHLSVHKKQHTGEKDHECDICGKRFITNSMRKKHMLCHLPNRPKTVSVKPKFKLESNQIYMCEFCGKIFKQRAHLNCHKAMHMEEKPHQCDHCNKSYKWRHTVWRHKKRHAGERRFKCSICSKDFIENSALKKHMRVHTGERPNQCHICSKAFKETWHLKTHLKMHN